MEANQACFCRPCGDPPTPTSIPYYNGVKVLCGFSILVLAIKTHAQRFILSSFVGLGAHWAMPELTEDVTGLPEACASGCTDIVGQSLNLKLDPRISLIVATVFFCCHIEHHGKEMVPVVGALFGARVFHSVQREMERYESASDLNSYFKDVSDTLIGFVQN